MTGSAIRELAAARTAPLVCAAFDEATIQVWDLSTQRKTGEFAARFASGGGNLALHPGGDSVVTGVSRKNGTIASYKVPGGEPMWLHDRLAYPAKIGFGSSGDSLFCTLDNRRVQRFDTRTGDKTELLQKTVQYIEGPDGHALTAASGGDYFLGKEQAIPIPKLTFAILDVAFGGDCLCISESTGPVRCIDYRSGTERWRYTPPEGSHALTLHYNGRDGFFYGVVWHYEKGHFRYLVRFDAETGQESRMRNLKSWEERFSEAAQQLVTSSGELIDLSTGEVAGELAFPIKEYPDRLVLT